MGKVNQCLVYNNVIDFDFTLASSQTGYSELHSIFTRSGVNVALITTQTAAAAVAEIPEAGIVGAV